MRLFLWFSNTVGWQTWLVSCKVGTEAFFNLKSVDVSERKKAAAARLSSPPTPQWWPNCSSVFSVLPQCLKIMKKVSFNKSYGATFTFWVDKSSLKVPKMVNFGEFLKPEECNQTVLPDRSFLIEKKLMKNAKIEKLKSDIFFCKMNHFYIFRMVFSINFGPIKNYLSGNTVWSQASVFQKVANIDHFWHF